MALSLLSSSGLKTLIKKKNKNKNNITLNVKTILLPLNILKISHVRKPWGAGRNK